MAKMKAFLKEIKKRNLYFNDNSSLRGVGHVISLVKTPFVKRLFWLVTLSACIAGSASVLIGVLKLYTQDVVSFSVETDYLTWDTPFPAVTICEKQLNETRLKSEFKKRKISTALISFVKDIALWTNRYCRFCPNCQVNVSCTEDYLPLVTLARATCDQLLTECWYDDEFFSCCDRYKPLMTEYGTCFTFNSALTGEGDGIKINRKRRLPTLKFTALTQVFVRVHSPGEMTSAFSENILGKNYYVPRGNNWEVDLVAEEIKSDRAVQSISPDSRQCLFQHETPPLERWPFRAYSLGACFIYCRAMVNIRLCNCTFHFMPRIADVPICNIEGLRCLNEFREKMDFNVALCPCPMTCDEVTYKVVESHYSPISTEAGQEARVTVGSVRIGQFPSLRIRRRVDRDMLGLVVDIGGVLGVFFGASILSFLEVIYIFCIRKYH